MVDIALASSVTSLLVGVVAVALMVLAFSAQRRSGNPQLLFVGAAFAVFVVKSGFSAYNVQTHTVPHDLIELVLSLSDLLILVLLVTPFLVRAHA